MNLDLGSQVGVVVITRASHLYDPGSPPGVRMWAEICPSLSDSEGFSPGTPVFLPPWRCALRSCMVRIAAARGAYICFRSDLVEMRCLCTLRRWWARAFLFIYFFLGQRKSLKSPWLYCSLSKVEDFCFEVSQYVSFYIAQIS